MSNLENVTIHQFRGLRDLELKDIGRINLLVGINNSGKTSVLEALSVYCHPLDIKVWLSTARQREQDIRVSRTQSIDALRWLFTHNSVSIVEPDKPIIFISSTGLFSVEKLIARYEEMEGIWLSEERDIINPIDRNEEEIENEQEIENEYSPGVRKGIDLKIEVFTNDHHLSLIDQSPNFTENFLLWEDEPLYRLSGTREPSLNTSIVTPSSHRSTIGQFRLLTEARFQNFKSDVVKLLQQMDKNISDIEILLSPESMNSRFNIYIQHERLGLAPVSTFGDGIRRLLHIALKLASVKGGILLIDELESTIHTEALQSSFQWLVKWCTEMDVQLFATTHSLEAVDALLEVTESDSDLVLYRLEPKEEKTKVVRHDGHRLRRLREELGQEVRW
ncbi:AAA family ATPase [Dolichospermum sp. ST_con]|nr:AAA family ATPase [Dolichospermum sp. ST_con]MDD1420806.1 AAA family ATPase [Dolichospermum sp. ST_sed1]MDD1426948.1 AAA family ATPase [Dolichospermum sp. ST_sed9]MDD1433187.1 AAA family ATPase [Dolichospermum sp. ST_sed6]MDD1434995.1 AAA family ATPase [Dolichospermum sp. ST_sed10]MDD1442539.1 AAA family ATPase [Dolichospermum sp. ST_sed3]MDD1447945.1 AAA family ATPase [Dolichospermum sp. ST_sed8]MDD1456464.1 AAA family ATPase [Dolichospermum sp. ST_sed7]MDD1462315.1 AAA family ATPase [D